MRNWANYLNREITCGCGKQHICEIEDIIIRDGALLQLPALLQRREYANICVVSDIHTEAAAGKKVKDILTGAGYAFASVVFPDEELLPDERAVGSLLIDLPAGCGLILAVGTGTINDLCRFVSSKLGVPYMIIATAASMDGFASNVAPLIVRNLKTTYEIGRPRAIIGDLEVLCQAPPAMTAAGVGDILGKYVCLTDWKISSIITGEYHCAYVESLIRESIDAVVQAAGGVARGEKAAVGAVMEGLILSGIAMSYVGNSRPASGSEHHLSHYWEMMSLFDGSHGALHGAKVGVGTVLGLAMYRKLPGYLAALNPDEDLPALDRADWDNQIRLAYRQAAPQVLRLEDQVHKNADGLVRQRRRALKEKTAEITQLIGGLPTPDSLAALLQKLDAPCSPAQIGVSQKDLQNSILYAKDLRNRFGLLQMLYDLGKAEEMAVTIAQEFPCRG